MQKELGKKGAEGFSMSFILALVVGVIALVLVVLWLSGVFDTISTDPIGSKDLELVAQSCILAAKNDLVTTYCKDWKELDQGSRTNYVNCEYDQIKPALDNARADGEITGTITCTENEVALECAKLRSDGERMDRILVNGQPCPDVAPEDLS